MHVYIPSRGRHTKAELRRGPVAQFTPAQRAETTYVVPTEEITIYKSGVAALWPEVKVVGRVYDTIGEKRALIGRDAEFRKRDRFAMMDDDINLLVRRSDDDWRLRAAMPDEVTFMLATMDAYLNTHASVGISAREGNNRAGVGDIDMLAMPNTRVMRCLAYRTKDFNACEHNRLPFMEDFDVQLQLLRKGLGNCCLYYWGNGQAMTNAPGGCAITRTHELHEASARKLAELHPGFVRLRQKTNKTDKTGLGTRTEVTIAWKRAAGEKGDSDPAATEAYPSE